jgi:hypothetical protein
MPKSVSRYDLVDWPKHTVIRGCNPQDDTSDQYSGASQSSRFSTVTHPSHGGLERGGVKSPRCVSPNQEAIDAGPRRFDTCALSRDCPPKERGLLQSQCDGMICRFDAFVVRWEYDDP